MRRDIYFALGDSITAGDGSSHPSLSFVAHVSRFVMDKSLATRTIVVAKNGWTTKDVFTAAQRVDAPIWDRTNVLTLISGGNDLRRLLRRQMFAFSGARISSQAVLRRLQTYRTDFNHLCHFIASKRIPHVVVGTLYNPLPNYDVAVDAICRLNDIAREVAKTYRFDVVGVYQTFRENEPYFIEGYRTGQFEDILSPIRRPIHPNNAGHKQIADGIMAHLTRKAKAKPALQEAKRLPQSKRRSKSG